MHPYSLNTWRHSNLVSGLLLQEHHDHHADEHGHEHRHDHHHDHNLRAAYLHVLADALTSVFALVALFAGKYYGWVWVDPAMGLVGAAVIGRWSYGLVVDTGQIMLDGGVDEGIRLAIKLAIEGEADNRITDLHVWHVGTHAYAVELAVVTHQPKSPSHYKELLRHIPQLAHMLVEVTPCEGESCPQPCGVNR